MKHLEEAVGALSSVAVNIHLNLIPLTPWSFSLYAQCDSTDLRNRDHRSDSIGQRSSVKLALGPALIAVDDLVT